jgi:hypothetical protein
VRTRERVAELRRLEALVKERRADWQAARHAAARPWQTADLAKPLCDYYANVAYRRRTADLEEEARLVKELMEEVVSRGLVLSPVDFRSPAAGFKLVDPGLDRAVDEAHTALREATEQLEAAYTEHSADIVEADKRAAVKTYRDAIAGGDPAAIVRAHRALEQFAAEPQQEPDGVMTTNTNPEVCA